MMDTFTLVRDMSRHALAVAVLGLAVIGPPVQAQDQPSAQELADLHARADTGEATAQHDLGFLYSDGLGVPQDHAEAAGWYRRAAEQGHATAQHGLGVMYSDGLGVPQDYVEAHMWLNLAASQLSGQSRERAVAARDAVARLMTPAELRDAQSRARALHAAQSQMRSGVPDAPATAGAVAGGAYRPGWGIVNPRVLREVNPQYTAEALRAKVTGTVVLELVVLPDGTVGDVRITRSLDPVLGLDEQAVKAARQWLFEPGTRFGEPVEVLVGVALDFDLK